MSVSTLSFGASSLGAVFHEINEDDAVRTGRVAVDHGINFIDVSPYYGATKAETVLGKALQAAGIGWDSNEAHSAAYDAERTAELFCQVCNRFNNSVMSG